mgnify:CR=1 FL=1
MGVSAVHPGTGKEIKVVNLLTVDGFRMMWSKAVTNFSTFAPLGMVLVCVLGAGVAEKSGSWQPSCRRCWGMRAPALVTWVIIFIGINGNVAGDAAFVVLPPVAGVIYLSMGRHPLLGVFTAFASVAAGFCANVMLGMSDSLAYGFTEAAGPRSQSIPAISRRRPSTIISWWYPVPAELCRDLRNGKNHGAPVCRCGPEQV